VKDEVNNLVKTCIYGMIDFCVDANKKILMKIYAEIKKIFL